MGGAKRYPSMPVRVAMGIAALNPSYEKRLRDLAAAPEVCIFVCPVGWAKRSVPTILKRDR
jgi:hypothetical protein